MVPSVVFWSARREQKIGFVALLGLLPDLTSDPVLVPSSGTGENKGKVGQDVETYKPSEPRSRPTVPFDRALDIRGAFQAGCFSPLEEEGGCQVLGSLITYLSRRGF